MFLSVNGNGHIYYTFYAGVAGGVTVIGDAGIGRVKQITAWHSNINTESARHAKAYRARYPDADGRS